MGWERCAGFGGEGCVEVGGCEREEGVVYLGKTLILLLYYLEPKSVIPGLCDTVMRAGV